jgi:L-threonylcarbamoyladenylate synthase
MAATLLEQGQLVAIPTETVYGLAANALDAAAVARIYVAKNRPQFNPLIVHCANAEQAFSYAVDVPEQAYALAQKFWPGPLTLILKKSTKIPDIVTAGHDWVGLRVPQHDITRALLQCLDFPLAAPSANPSGYVSPTTAQHVLEGLNGKIAYILDGGACTVGVESTIISFAGSKPQLLRYGGVTAEAIKEIIPDVVMQHHQNGDAPLAPGQLASHYAPGKKVIIGNLSELLETYAGKNVAVISLQKTYPQVDVSKQIQLSPSGELEEAAQQIFSALRILDKTDAEYILAELMPEEGIGRAINDRIRRAAV